MSDAESSLIKSCPKCGAGLASSAVLCVQCGFHLQLQRHLQTKIELLADSQLQSPAPEPRAVASDLNPYAPPQSSQTHGAPRNLELTEADANWARIIVSDAEYMPWLLVASLCCCTIPMPLMLPYYAYRLANWTKLDSTFSELHSPNSFSPHGQLAAKFQDARLRLILGVAFGAFFYAAALVFGVIRLLQVA